MLNLLHAFRCRAAGVCLLLLVALLVPVTVTLAQQDAVQTLISEDAAVAMIRRQTEGKVVRVERETKGNALVYRIRVLSPDGRLREYRVDAATGSVR